MRVLVTGSNGQLGMSLRKIAGESHDFVFTDINDIPGQETVRLDITDKDAVMSMNWHFILPCLKKKWM